jgi:hypothetical protein
MSLRSNPTSWLFVGCLAVVSSLVASCSGHRGGSFTPSVLGSSTVGPAGGTVTANGVTLTFAPGAVSRDTTITIGQATDVDASNLPAGVTGKLAGPPFQFGPSGLHFNAPVTATVPYTSSSSNPLDLVVALRDDVSGNIDLLRPTAAAGGAVTVSLAHFSTSQPVQSQAPPPTISDVSPSTGNFSGGESVTISGDDFRGGGAGLQVFFGGIPAQSASIVSSSVASIGSNGGPGRATVIQVVTPPATQAGPVDVTVQNADGPSATLAGGYAYRTAGTPTTLAWIVQPTGGYVAATLPAIKVAVQDQNGNLMSGTPVTVALGANPSGATLSGTLTQGNFVPTVFGDLRIDRVGTGYTLVVSLPSCPSVPPIASGPFDVRRVPATLQWSDAGSVAVNHFDGTVAAIGSDGLLYVTGGIGSAFGAPPTPVESCSTNPVSQVGTPPGITPYRARFAGVAGTDGRIYAIGGMDWPSGAAQGTVQVYTPWTNTWSTVASLPTPRYEFAAACGADGRIYAIGGKDAHDADLASVEVYDPAQDTWTTAHSLSSARGFLAATTGHDGRIYVLGGMVNGFPTGTAEAYDPTLDAWTSLPPLPTPRWYLAAATDPNGAILAIGGATDFGNQFTVGTVEAYSNVSQTWRSLPGLITPRTQLAAVNAPDGRILAVGGLDLSGNWANHVESYGPTTALSPASGPAGTIVTVTGTSFAPNAAVTVTWGPTATPIATGTTDGNGSIATGLTFTVPASSPGAATVTVVDDRSNYPSTATFTVN